MGNKTRRKGLKVLRSGDPRSQFITSTAKEILDRLGRPKSLLSSSSKIRKGEKVGILTKVLYLTSGLFCPGASPGCLKSCLGHSSGFMKEQHATDARDRRSALYVEDNVAFIQLLRMELYQHCYDAETQGMIPAIRLNGTSDIPWEALHGELFAEFRQIEFYDYTKLPSRMVQFLQGRLNEQKWPANYHLTFSLSERNSHHAQRTLREGGNVATVFWPEVPRTWLGCRVIDGDQNDARFLDSSPAIVGLSAKGFVAREADLSGFVIRTDRPATSSLQNVSNFAA